MIRSQRLSEIVRAYGGAQLDVLRIFRSMLQVLTASGVQITSHRPTRPQSATCLAREKLTVR
jgi:hypothetical protein